MESQASASGSAPTGQPPKPPQTEQSLTATTSPLKWKRWHRMHLTQPTRRMTRGGSKLGSRTLARRAPPSSGHGVGSMSAFASRQFSGSWTARLPGVAPSQR